MTDHSPERKKREKKIVCEWERVYETERRNPSIGPQCRGDKSELLKSTFFTDKPATATPHKQTHFSEASPLALTLFCLFPLQSSVKGWREAAVTAGSTNMIWWSAHRQLPVQMKRPEKMGGRQKHIKMHALCQKKRFYYSNQELIKCHYFFCFLKLISIK